MKKTAILGIAALSVPGIILMLIIINTMQNQASIIAALSVLIIALFALAAFFAFRLSKQTEVRTTEDVLRIFLNSVPMVCGLYDKNNKCLEINDEAKRMFNTSKQEYIENFEQKYLPKLQPDGTDSQEKTLDYYKEAYKKGSLSYEFMYQLADGTPVPVKETLQRITINGEDHIVSYFRDLREEKKLREKELLIQKQAQVMAEQLNRYVEMIANNLSVEQKKWAAFGK